MGLKGCFFWMFIPCSYFGYSFCGCVCGSFWVYGFMPVLVRRSACRQWPPVWDWLGIRLVVGGRSSDPLAVVVLVAPGRGSVLGTPG